MFAYIWNTIEANTTNRTNRTNFRTPEFMRYPIIGHAEVKLEMDASHG